MTSHFELLTRRLSFNCFTFELLTQVKKFQIKFEITDQKTEKKDSLYFILYFIEI